MRQILKRTLDIIVSATALVLLAPVMMVIAILIWSTMGRPILFRQERAGHRGKPFTIFKFRTMLAAFDPHGCPLPDGARLTRVGMVLRRLSFDEFPQLFNVLIGHMSLVGPRPLLVEYLSRYSSEQARRHDVRPGITGWAQVNGRNAIDWGEKFVLDVWYVDHWSLGLDACICWKTMIGLLKGEGVSGRGHVTMPQFTGNEPGGV